MPPLTLSLPKKIFVVQLERSKFSVVHDWLSQLMWSSFLVAFCTLDYHHLHTIHLHQYRLTRQHDSTLSTLSSEQDEPSKFKTSSVQAKHPLRSRSWRHGRFMGSFFNAFAVRREQFLRESCVNFWKIEFQKYFCRMAKIKIKNGTAVYYHSNTGKWLDGMTT